MPKHTEERVLSYTPQQMFDLVADVASYPDFLPWCSRAEVSEQEDNHFIADLTLGYKMFSATYTSKVILHRDRNEVEVIYQKGPFKYLENIWKLSEDEEGCHVHFYVNFEFESPLFEKMIGKVFEKATQKMVSAFEDRAKELYG